jgi:hypothetical protein
MTIENDIDALVAEVTIRKAAVVKAKGDLDAILVEGASAAGQAEGAALAALSARDESSAMATASEALATASVGATAYADLAAVAAAKVEDAVDVFIYDTSLDSDGGAWRYRTQGTSWYREALNTTTRGARREFPAVAVIVAVAGDAVTIYDGDDPALPMWMAFPRGSTTHWFDSAQDVTSTSALNGVVCVGSKYDEENRGGLRVFNFVTDTGYHFAGTYQAYNGFYKGGIAQRGETGRTFDGSGSMIADRRVNDVAMTVLPDAPIDPATSLPVPTIAVATDGGVSVIKDDGVVVDLTKLVSGSVNASRVVFLEDGGIAWSSRDVNRYIQVLNAIPDADYAGDPDRLYSEGDQPAPGTDLNLLNLYAASHLVNGACAGGDGVTFLAERPDAPEKGMVAYCASTYATGWMPGMTKGAWLADIDEDDLAESGELVVNGGFAEDLSAWTSGGSDAGMESPSSGAARLVGNQYLYQTISGLIAGQDYLLTANIVGTNSQGSLRIGTSINVGDIYDSPTQNSATSLTRTFTPPGTAVIVTLKAEGNVGDTAAFMDFDDVSVRLADPDRSVNANGLIVHGRVRRTPVADGAELMAYSGFSAENYLEGADASYVDTLYALGWEQNDGSWDFKHGVLSATPIDGLTITGNTIRIAGTKPKALIRLTATVPTAGQLVKIEADERALFEPDAACTLYGNNDAVTALAYDKVTNLLHVGTSAGRSVFDGLRRVAHTTSPVGNAIAAHNGLIIED